MTYADAHNWASGYSRKPNLFVSFFIQLSLANPSIHTSYPSTSHGQINPELVKAYPASDTLGTLCRTRKTLVSKALSSGYTLGAGVARGHGALCEGARPQPPPVWRGRRQLRRIHPQPAFKRESQGVLLTNKSVSEALRAYFRVRPSYERGGSLPALEYQFQALFG